MKRSVLVVVAICVAFVVVYFLLCRGVPASEKPAVPEKTGQTAPEPPAGEKPAETGVAVPAEPPKTPEGVTQKPEGKTPVREPKAETRPSGQEPKGEEPVVRGEKPTPAPREPEQLKGAIRGRVVRVDKSPVTRFYVNRAEQSDPEGRFQIAAAREGDRIVIRADDPALAPAVIRITTQAIRTRTVPEVVLDAGREIGGEVLDAKTREPIAGARVTLADPSEVKDLGPGQDLTRIVEPVFSKAAGVFVLSHAPWGDWLIVTHREGYVLDLSILSSSEPVKVLLKKGGSIQGTVLGASGQPLAHQRVVAMSGSSIDATEATTDAAGKFRVGPMRVGRYVIVPTQEAGPEESRQLAPVSVDVVDGRTETVMLQPQASGATVRVKAVDAQGRPAQGGVVLIAGTVPQPATFSALLESGALFPAKGRDSHQVIAGVPPGSYTLFVIEERGRKHPGLYQQSVQVFDNSDLAIEVKLPDSLPTLPDPLQARFGTLSPL